MTNINRRRFPILLASALALLAILGALFLPDRAQAQTETIVLVSNIGQTSDAFVTLMDGDLEGQVFTVASGGGNYTLTSIEVPVELINTTALTAEDIERLSASLWSADAFGAPVSSLQTLDNPSSISDGDTATFTDPSGTTLEAGKSYAVVLVYNKSSDELQIKAVGSGSEDGASLAGWYISNLRRFKAATATAWSQDGRSIQIRVNGSAVSGDPPPSCTLNTGDLWCGVVTVGEIKTTDDALVGHGFVEAGGLSAGSLAGNPDDTMFSVGGNDYTIQGVYIQVPTAEHLTGTLSVVLTADLTDDDKAGLLLPVDGTTTPFEFSDASKAGTTGQNSWGSSGLSWSVGDTVTIRVRPRTLSVADASDAENDGEVEFTVTLSEAAATAVTATWTASIETGDTAVAADLGTTKTGTVTVAIGDTMGTFEVPVVNDSTDEGDETFTVTLSSPSTNAKLETDPTATGTIEDDDATPTTPTLSVADAAAVTEGSPATFVVTLSPASTQEVMVTWSASTSQDTTATADSDFTKAQQTLTFAPGETTKMVAVETLDDTLDEEDGETFSLTLVVPVNAMFEGGAQFVQVVGTIDDNDALPMLSAAAVSAEEGAGLTFTVALSAESGRDVTVAWAAASKDALGDTAKENTDVTPASGTLTFTGRTPVYDGDGDLESTTPGETSKMFTVSTTEDSLDEDDETFTVTLSSPTNADISDATAKGTITDDDSLPVLQLGSGGTDEANVPALSVSVTPASGREVMVTWTATIESGNTAEAADFTDLSTATGTVTIPAGRSSYVFFLNGVVADDSLDEDIETFTVTLSSPVNATLAILKAATVSIRDDDPTPTVTVADAAANEGDKVEFVVTLSAVSGRDVDVDYATSVATGDGAVSGTDFTAASGTLTIAAVDNTDTGTIEVQTTQEDASESAETFTLTISSPDNATLTTDTTATGTINDDDATPQPTTFAAAVGNAQVVLSWDAPDSASGVTRHEYQYKEGTGAYQGWVQIANSGVGGTNEAGFTVTSLTNEVLHTFQLRAVNAQGESTAAEADAVTPTPGICVRPQKMHEIIVYYLGEGGVERTCAEVNVANLASFTDTLEIPNESIASLKTGDFAGLTNVTDLLLGSNIFTTLPANVFSGLSSLEVLELSAGDLISLDARAFSGLTSLEEINLGSNDLSSLPAGVFSGLSSLTSLNLEQNELSSLLANVFSGLSALEKLRLGDNNLTALPAGVFSGLTALKELKLEDNNLTSLDARQFSGLTSLEEITLNGNALTALPAGLLAGLTSLEELGLRDNELTALPAGLFSGLTGLFNLELDDNPDSGDVLSLTVTVEKVGTDQVRAKVLAGAPFNVNIPVTPENGTLAGGVTALNVAKGAVESAAVTVTRTDGTTAAVTVDVDLSTQPMLPSNHSGYIFARAPSGLPAEILPEEASLEPPTGLSATPGDRQAVLAWTPPASDSGFTRHQYRYRTDGDWTESPTAGRARPTGRGTR